MSDDLDQQAFEKYFRDHQPPESVKPIKPIIRTPEQEAFERSADLFFASIWRLTGFLVLIATCILVLGSLVALLTGDYGALWKFGLACIVCAGALIIGYHRYGRRYRMR
jgi:hypothetical protein